MIPMIHTKLLMVPCQLMLHPTRQSNRCISMDISAMPIRDVYKRQIYTSAVDAAAQYDGKVIGVDVDQFPKIGDACITSAMKGYP